MCIISGIVTALGVIGSLSLVGSAGVGAGVAGTTFATSQVIMGGLMVGAVAGTATMGAMSAVQASQAQEYQSDLADNNAQQERIKADLARKDGLEKEKMQRLRTAQLKGQQRASYGASGTLVDKGSALDAVIDTSKKGEYDALSIRDNANKLAWGHNATANNLSAQSKLHSYNANNSLYGGIGNSMVGAGSSLMSHGTSIGLYSKI